MRKFIAIILCAALLIPFFSAQAGEIPKLTNGDYEYALNEDGTAIITKYLGHETEVVVPASLDGIAVTIIGKDAFNGNSELIGITIPEGVRVIEAGAFDRCKQLTGITLPVSLETLGDRAFRNCQSLKTFTVPAGLAGIGSGTFDYCTGLAEFAVSPENKSFHVFDGVLFDTRTNTLVCYPCARTGTDYAIPEGTEHITQNAFNYALNLTRVIIPASMTEIGEYAFYNAESLSAIEIPARVTKIGAYAFYGCKSLKEMNIPEGLTDIGTVAFVGCDSLTDIRVSPNNKDYASQNGILFDKAMTTMVACPGGMGDERMKIPEGVSVIGDGAFGHCNLLVHIEIPPGITTIGGFAFDGCSGLEQIYIPDSVMNIDQSAFRYCNKLTDIRLPAVLREINFGLFERCENLKTIELPEGLTAIRQSAFQDCTNLKELVIPGSVAEIEYAAFKGCAGLVTLSIPEGVSVIGEYAFGDCENLVLQVSEGSYAQQYAVENSIPYTLLTSSPQAGMPAEVQPTPEPATELTPSPASDFEYTLHEDGTAVITRYLGSAVSLDIPGQLDGYPVTEIGPGSFTGNAGIVSLTIPEGVKVIGKQAFMSCLNLTDLSLPESLKEIGMLAFYKCGKLSSANLPSGITKIRDSSFADCDSLVMISIPDSVDVIESAVFYSCDALEQIIVGQGNAAFSSRDGVLYDKTMGTLLAYPNGNKAEIFTTPLGMTKIAYYAFSSSSHLKMLTVSQGVQSIGQGAFRNCYSLEEIVIPASVTSIEPEAFDNCEKLRLRVTEGSYANQYALDNYVPFTSISPQTGMPAETQPSPEPATELTPSPTSDFEYTLLDDGTAVITRYLGSAVSLDIPGQLGGYPVSELGAYSFSKCAGLEYAGIPDGVRSIGENAFTSCKNLKEIRIPDSVTGIGEWAFALNPNFSTVSIPGGIRNISKGMFHYCTALEDIVIPAGVTEIGESAFAGCNMKGIVLPDGIESIGSNAFSACPSLTDISIPASVAAIGPGAFSYSHSLSGITVTDGNPVYETVDGVLFDKVWHTLHTFPAGTDRSEYEVPQGTEKIGDYAFISCSILQNITLPDSVVDIGSGAFYSSGLTRITLPPNVTSIREGLFAYCFNLESVSVPAGITNIENDAFVSCDKLTLEVEEGSFARQYAAENNIPFRLLSALTAADIPETTAPSPEIPMETAPPSPEIPVETVTPLPEVPMETAVPMPEITPETLPEATPLPTEMPLAEETARPNPWPTDAVTLYDLKAVNKGDERAMAWSGPGKNYRSAGAFKTNKLSRVKGVFIQGDYILVDMDYTGVGKRRVYFRKSAFKNTSAVPSGNMAGYGAVSTADALLYYGPGTDYDDFDGEYLPGGTQISVFFEEDGWLFAEFMTSEGLTRAWIESKAIQGAGL